MPPSPGPPECPLFFVLATLRAIRVLNRLLRAVIIPSPSIFRHFLFTFLLISANFYEGAKAQAFFASQCPVGMAQDGSCPLGFCFSKDQRCIGGVCCRYSSGAGYYNQCPAGMFRDGSCAVTGICFDPQERCIQGVCCQYSNNNYPTYPQYPNFGQYSSPYNGYYPNYRTAGYGYSPYGLINGYGIGTGIGLYGAYASCRDQYLECPLYARYCFFEAIAEACMGSCRLCGGALGGYAGGYGALIG